MDRISAIAERVAAPSGFTRLVPIRFKPPYGTSACLANARMIAEAGYKLEGGYIEWDTNKADYKTTAFFSRGDLSLQSRNEMFVFNGFSLGYGGEGPRGLMEFGAIFGWKFKEENVFGRAMVEASDPGSAKLEEL